MFVVLRALNSSESTNTAISPQSVLRLLNSSEEPLLIESFKLLQRETALASDDSTIVRLFELADDMKLSPSMRLRSLLSIPAAKREFNDQRWHLIRDNVTIGADSMARSFAAQLLRKSAFTSA